MVAFAYIKAWQDKLTEDPSALFTAIADADKISRYVIAKEQEFNKSQAIEYYAIKQDKNDYDDIVFKAYMISEYGQVRQILGYAFESRDALMKEFNVMKGLTYWSNKEFVEVLKKLEDPKPVKCSICSVDDNFFIIL